MKRHHFSINRIILIILLFFLSSSIIAQELANSTISTDQLNLYNDKAANLRTTGMIMTLAGFPIYTTGFLLLINYVIETPAEERGGLEPKLYAGMAIGGAISSVVGVNLWVTGRRKMKAEVALKAYNIKADSSMAVGLGIKIRF